MLEKVRIFLVELLSAVQAAKIYSPDHPQFRGTIERAARELDEIFEQRENIIIGLVENELAWEEEILFDLSQKLRSLILYLKERGIERISFERPQRKGELGRFVTCLINPEIKDFADPEDYFTQRDIQHIHAGKIRRPGGQKIMPEDFLQHYEATLQTTMQSIEGILVHHKISSLNLAFSILDITDSFVRRYQQVLILLAMKDKDTVTFAHLLNVSALSMYFLSKLGYSKEEVINLGNAALFHDIGKVYLSSKILQKKGSLDEGEFAKIREHSIIGAKILRAYKDTLGILAPLLAFEHHMGYDLKGYPRVIFSYQPLVASKIVSMCDVYDALSQRRTYKHDYPPLKIFDVMTKEKGKLFDPDLVDEFFKAMGVWPVGTIVVLSDQSVAVVRGSNEKDIFRPKVEVISPIEKREFLDLIERKDKLEITDSLSPFGEGRKYLEFI